MTKILLADDSVTIQKVVELTFSEEASQVVAVSDGATAFEKAQMDRPDIILSDVIMPGMNGYEFCYKIKTDPGLKNIPFLFLKGTFESFDEDKAKQAGADGFIVKPFESQELINKVKELIARSASLEAPAPMQEAAPVQPAAAAVPVPPVPPTPPAAAPPAPPPPAPPMPQAAVPVAEPPVVSSELFGGEAVPGEMGIDEVSAPPPAAEDAFFGEAERGESHEEDLWSEVSLRDTKAPLVEDKALEEESFWGTSDELGEATEEAQPEAASGESLIEEVDEAEIMDLTEEEVPLPPAAASPPPPPVEAEELFEPFEAPEVAVAEPVAPAAPAAPVAAAPAAMPVPAVEPAPPTAPVAGGTELENVLGAKIEEAVRTHLGPVIGEAAARIVEEVAWEIIPDLAESMIKNEIERIKREAGGKGGM
jgi:CheY-like chemotaxis protein